MPLPVAHTLAGLAVAQVQPMRFFDKKWQDVLFLIIISNSADLDFLPGFLIGSPNLYHHGISHSLGAALLVGMIAAWFFRKKGGYWKYALVIFLCYYFHVFLDFLTEDRRTPYGVLLFWPFNQEYFISPFLIFKKVNRSENSLTFFQSLFNRHNFSAAWREFWIMGLLIGFIKLLSFGKKQKKAHP
ncbi:MAG: metal-dependent hydrolase [Candidatus Aureabacteria bacterium]|nr:metal-dependent hydrolase [Candidatus Auribacterota bacterium]